MESKHIVREISPKKMLFRTFVGDISQKLSSFGVKSARKKTCGKFMRTIASLKTMFVKDLSEKTIKG